MVKNMRAVWAVIGLVAFVGAAHGEELPSAPVALDIPRQALGDSLNELARQAGLHLAFYSTESDGLIAPAIKGSYTPAKALEALLAGTKLTYWIVDGGTIAVGKEKPATLRWPEAEAPSDEALEEVFVRGKPFTDANVDIVRTEDDPQAYYIFRNHDLVKSNASNVEEFLRQKLTMNATTLSNSQRSYQGSSTSEIDLRGLGENQTLILVNGRRVAGAGSAFNSVTQFDVNSFAPSMIERLEVLPSSASAIYGGNAIGGVLNIILKRDFTGGDFRVAYDTPLDANAPTRSITGGYGWSFQDGRTNITVSASYRDNDSLLYRDRQEFVARGFNRVLERAPELLYEPGFPYNSGTTPNITTLEGEDLVLKGGVSLDSPFTYIPAGTSPGTSAEQLRAGLLANAGQQNTTAPPTILGSHFGLLNPFTSEGEASSVYGAVRHKVTDRLELIAEFFHNRNDSSQPYEQTLPEVIPADAPTNPFEQDVWVMPPLSDTSTPPILSRKEFRSKRMVAGFVLDLPHDWRAQGDYTWNRGETHTRIGPSLYDHAPLWDALADGSVNPFVDTLAYPINLKGFAASAPVNLQASAATLSDIGLRVSGPVGHLPGGRPNLTLGLGRRNEKQPWGYADNGPDDGLFTFLPMSQRVSSLYAEALVPLVGAGNAVPGVRRLELQLASRIERFSVDSGTAYRRSFPPNYTPNPDDVVIRESIDYRSTNMTIGLRYKPIEDLTLRASHATAFLPPGFSDFVPGIVGPTERLAANDPSRGNELIEVPFRYGGNPDLEPMDSTSWTLGVIFEPARWPGFRAGLERFRIERENLIFDPSVFQILDNEALFPGRVVREAAQPGDPYGVGPITFIDLSLINASHVVTEGFDLSLGYRKTTERQGTFSIDLLGTLIDSFTQQFSLAAPEAETAGIIASGGPLKLRANATLGWERGPWSLSWTTSYFGPYDQARNPLYLLAQGRATIPHQMYHDVGASYRFPSEPNASGLGRALADLQVSLSVRNVFDTMPPFDAYQRISQFSSPFGDYRLRSVQLAIGKRF